MRKITKRAPKKRTTKLKVKHQRSAYKNIPIRVLPHWWERPLTTKAPLLPQDTPGVVDVGRKELGKSFEPDVRGDSTIDYFIAGLIAGFVLGAIIL